MMDGWMKIDGDDHEDEGDEDEDKADAGDEDNYNNG